MNRLTLRSTLMAAALTGTLAATAVPTYARSQSAGSTVLVADDITSQALVNCKVQDGTPCPAWSLQAFKVYPMSLADAQAQGRSYVPVGATQAQVNTFVHQRYPHTPPPTGLYSISMRNAFTSKIPTGSRDSTRPGSKPTSRLASCAADQQFSEWYDPSVPTIGAAVDFQMTWGNNTDCSQYAIKDRIQWKGGHGLWAYTPDSVFYQRNGPTPGFIQDADSAPAGCIGLPGNTYTFGGSPMNQNSGPYTQLQYFSGSNCVQGQDTEYVYDYYWGS